MSTYEYGVAAQLASLLRRSPVREIKRCLGLAQQHGIAVSARELEAHHLAGGRLVDLVEALVFAREHGMILSLQRAVVQDLARGREVSVKDWVQDCHRRGVKDLDAAPIS